MTGHIRDDGPVEYSVYRASYADVMAVLLADAFTRHDPPAVAVGLTSAEFEAFVRLLTASAAEEQLTIVARLAGSGEIIGALLVEDCSAPPPDGMDRLNPKLDPIFGILGELGTEFWGDRSIAPGESLHLFLLGVSEKAAGKGVGSGLVATCLANGLRRGYTSAVTEATNKVSQHIFRKHGFVDRVSRSYGDYRFGGKVVFASIADVGGPILMEKRLAP